MLKFIKGVKLMKNYGIPMGILIRSERKKRNLTVVQLAEETNYSRSYLSRIENGAEVDESVYINILNYFGIKDYTGAECEEYSKLLSTCMLDLYYLRCDKNKLEEILFDIEPYKYSCIYAKFMIIKLMYYVLFIDSENKEKNKFITEISEISYLFSIQEQQIINDYLGYELINKDSEAANKYFDIALTFGIHNYSTSILYYHIGILKCIKNDLCDALYFCLKAHERFSLELNHIRLFYTQLHIANIFSISGNYIKASMLYERLVESTIIPVEDKTIVYSNMSWNYYKSGNFKEAIRYGKLQTNKNYAYYLHMILIYYALSDIEKVTCLLNETKHIILSDFQIKIFKILENEFILKNKTSMHLSLLIDTYEQAKIFDEVDVVSILNNFIVTYYEDKRQYKDANYYLKQRYK